MLRPQPVVSGVGVLRSPFVAITMKQSSFVAVILFVMLPSLAAWAEEKPVSFRAEIAPLLIERCVACHGPKKAEGGYRADSFHRAMAEGDSGSPGFAGGSIDTSEAFRRMISTDLAERMPAESDPLPAEQIALIRRWIEEGAKFDGPDPQADLVSVIPAPQHPKAPEAYPFTMPVTALLFSQDGKELFVGGYHELTVWNPEDGKLIRRIGNVGQRTYGLDLSPDGQTLAVACGAPGKFGEARLFNPATGELKTVVGPSSDVVLDVAFNPAGDHLAVASADGILRVFNVATGAQLLLVSSHSDWVNSVAWSPDGSKIATGSRDKTAKVIDAKTGELLVTYSGHGEPVKGVTFHPGGAEVFSSGSDSRIHRWAVADGKKATEVRLGGEVYKLVKGGDHLFATSADKTVRHFAAGAFSQTRSLAGHQDWVISVAGNVAAKRIASGGFDGEVRVWNLDDGNQVSKFLAAPGK